MGDGGGQLDLFSVSAIDPPPWRDNRDVMGYPFLALQKRRTVPIEYDRAGVSVGVYPHPKIGSIATIWDWDVMIFAASHINEAIESGQKVSPEIDFAPYNCLKQIGRHTGGGNYQELAQAIRRLSATMVITNIRETDQPTIGREQGFHWLSGYSLPKKYGRRVYTTPDNITHITPRDPDGEPDPARPWMIELPAWIYNAIVRQGDILAVHPDYFQLSGGLDRWLYRLARKAVPDKADPPAIRFKMETLHERSGVTRDLRHFACDIRKLADSQPLPEYGIQIQYRKGQRELVTLYRDPEKPCRPPRGRRLKTIQGEHIEPAVNVDAYLEPGGDFLIEPAPAAKALAAPEPTKPDPLKKRRRIKPKPKSGRKVRAKGTPARALKDFAELKQRLAAPEPKPVGPMKADFTFPDGTRVSIKPPASADPEAALRQMNYYLRQLQGAKASDDA